MPDIPYREGDPLPPAPPEPQPAPGTDDAVTAAPVDVATPPVEPNACVSDVGAGLPPSPGLEPEDSGLKMPYGPFLALGALEYFFFGDRILDAYFSFIGG